MSHIAPIRPPKLNCSTSNKGSFEIKKGSKSTCFWLLDDWFFGTLILNERNELSAKPLDIHKSDGAPHCS